MDVKNRKDAQIKDVYGVFAGFLRVFLIEAMVSGAQIIKMMIRFLI